MLPKETDILKEAELAKQAEKMGLKLKPQKTNSKIVKSILHQSDISMFMPSHKLRLDRCMVLTPKALVVYKESKDKANFQFSSHNKPWMVIPLCEIQDVEIYKASDKKKDISFDEEAKPVVSSLWT